MGEVVDIAPGERARQAVADGRWHDADELLTALRAQRPLTAAELELCAGSAYGAGRFEAAITAFEDAHAAYLVDGDVLGAAGAATSVATYLMMDTGLMAPVRGWASRAERLLEACGESPVHAWLEMVRTYERLLSGDVERAGEHAQRTIEVGTRQGAPAPVAVARVATARLLILDGRIHDGLALLDEVATVVVAGDLDALPSGMVFCELICAMQGLAQYDRAEEWTDAMERWRGGVAFGGFNGRCRVHRAEILRLRGSCEDAESEALRACDELRPWMRRELGWPLTELGTIRLRRGDLPGAQESFLAAHRLGWDPHPGLALLRLEQGEVPTAAALIADAVERPARVPSKERPPHGELRLAPLLEAQVRIAVADGDAPTARRAADRLTAIADRFHSRALLASAASARGRVALAAGDLEEARIACEDAVIGWCGVGAPYETALARMVLADVHRRTGNSEPALLEARAAQVEFERIGAVGQAAAAADAYAGLAAGRGPRAAWPVATGRAVFRCRGDSREVEYDGRAVLLRDLKGLRYLARLLAEPGREFHVLDLVAAERGLPTAPAPATTSLAVSTGGGLGPLLDEEAKRAYRRRLAEIDEDLDEADRRGDPERAAQAAADRDFILSELGRAVGLHGQDRPVASDAERARTSVTRAVRYAMDRIGEHHPALADHLAHAVATGTYCGYDPDPRARPTWVT